MSILVWILNGLLLAGFLALWLAPSRGADSGMARGIATMFGFMPVSVGTLCLAMWLIEDPVLHWVSGGVLLVVSSPLLVERIGSKLGGAARRANEPEE